MVSYITYFICFSFTMACGGWEGGVDPGQLEARLRAGIEADRRYAAENSAKIRAIHSAPTYDEFRQLVLGKEMSALMFDKLF